MPKICVPRSKVLRPPKNCVPKVPRSRVFRPSMWRYGGGALVWLRKKIYETYRHILFTLLHPGVELLCGSEKNYETSGDMLFLSSLPGALRNALEMFFLNF